MNFSDIKRKLIDKGYTDVKVIDGGNHIEVVAKSKTGNADSNMADFMQLFPDGRILNKDVIVKLDESDSVSYHGVMLKLYELTPHPSLIEVGHRVSIDHKSYGEISVVVKKIKRYDRSNELDGFYWTSAKKGIMGFSSFDNVKRLYNPQNAGKGKDPKNWVNHDKRSQLGYINESSESTKKFTQRDNIEEDTRYVSYVLDHDGHRINEVSMTLDDALFCIKEMNSGRMSIEQLKDL